MTVVGARAAPVSLAYMSMSSVGGEEGKKSLHHPAAVGLSRVDPGCDDHSPPSPPSFCLLTSQVSDGQ